jgi:hypothetical protein
METNIEYGNTKEEKDIFVYRINDYEIILDDLKMLEKKKKDLKLLLKKYNKRSDLAEYNNVILEYTRLINSKEGKKAIELNNNAGFIDSFKYNYYNLVNMKPDIIDDISIKINSNNYKYYAVDNNFNIINSYTTSELIKFTKGISMRSDYPVTIIDYIIFAKMQQNKNINI